MNHIASAARHCRAIFVLLLLTSGSSAFAATFDEDVDSSTAGGLNGFVLARAKSLEVAASSAAQGDPAKKVSAPTAGASQMSLVATPETTDVVGLALGAAGVSSSGEKSAATGTFTLYALQCALTGHAFLDPQFYNSNDFSRRLSLTYSRDSGDTKADKGNVYEAKYILLSPKNDRGAASKIQGLMKDEFSKTTSSFGRASLTLKGALVDQFKDDPTVFSATAEPDVVRRAAALNYLDGHMSMLKSLTEERKAAVDEMVKNYVAHATATSKVVLDQLDKLAAKPTVSWSVQTKHRSTVSQDDLMGQLAYNQSFSDTRSITANLSYGRKWNSLSSATHNGIQFGLEYKIIQGASNNLEEKNSKPEFDLSLVQDSVARPNITKAQVAYIIKLPNGATLPLSLTFANRKEFINEGKVRGHIGYTFDLEKFDWKKLIAGGAK